MKHQQKITLQKILNNPGQCNFIHCRTSQIVGAVRLRAGSVAKRSRRGICAIQHSHDLRRGVSQRDCDNAGRLSWYDGDTDPELSCLVKGALSGGASEMLI